MNQSKKFKYEDVFSGKLWINDNKSSQTDPDFKGQLCTKADIDNVTTRGSDGKKNIDEMGAEIFEEFITFASGRKTKSEILNLGRHEFAPWQIGITG